MEKLHRPRQASTYCRTVRTAPLAIDLPAPLLSTVAPLRKLPITHHDEQIGGALELNVGAPSFKGRPFSMFQSLAPFETPFGQSVQFQPGKSRTYCIHHHVTNDYTSNRKQRKHKVA